MKKFIHNIANHWDGYTYHKVSLPQNSINKNFIDLYKFRGDEKILDIGCGSGFTSRYLASKVPNGHVLGSDQNSSMINFAGQHSTAINITYKKIAAEEIDFDNVFDCVTSFFCIQWIANKQETFDRINKALKANGSFLMITPLPHKILPKVRNHSCQSDKWKKYFFEYTDPLSYIYNSNYSDFHEKSNLILEEYKIVKDRIFFNNYDSFRDFMLQMTPQVSRLDNHRQKEEFIFDLLNEYLKYNQVDSGDNKYFIDYDLVKSVAKKVA